MKITTGKLTVIARSRRRRGNLIATAMGSPRYARDDGIDDNSSDGLEPVGVHDENLILFQALSRHGLRLLFHEYDGYALDS